MHGAYQLFLSERSFGMCVVCRAFTVDSNLRGSLLQVNAPMGVPMRAARAGANSLRDCIVQSGDEKIAIL